MALNRNFLLAIICLLGAMNFTVVFRNVRFLTSETHYTWIGHDFPPTLPLSSQIPLVRMTVEETVFYPLGEAGDEQWRSTDSAGWGYCRLGPHNRLFAVTMFHELHCLRILNLGFGKGAHMGHILHCLSYLRHGALCSADVTLEPGDFAERNFTSDRVGATHECRDWGAAYRVMQENWGLWKANKG